MKANLFSLLNTKLNDLVPYVLLSSFLNCGGNARSFTGTSKGRAHVKKAQRNKRGTKQGSKKGRKGARVGKKTVYVAKVRSLRRLLKIAKDRKDLTNPEFWELYKKVGGNTVRNKAHLRTLMDEIKTKRQS